jgi:hypothetical protein
MFLSSFSLPFLLILYFWFFCCVDINVVEIEARANEILRSISAKEDAKIQEHLGGIETIVSSYFVVFMIVWLPLAAALRKQSIWQRRVVKGAPKLQPLRRTRRQFRNATTMVPVVMFQSVGRLLVR